MTKKQDDQVVQPDETAVPTQKQPKAKPKDLKGDKPASHVASNTADQDTDDKGTSTKLIPTIKPAYGANEPLPTMQSDKALRIGETTPVEEAMRKDYHEVVHGSRSVDPSVVAKDANGFRPIPDKGEF